MQGGYLNGLDLFSGIGGITIALEPWVRPVAYCENEPFTQLLLLQKMRNKEIAAAPIWDDVQTLRGSMLPPVDIIYGGFPCQDISSAGNGAGLEGKRSGLFFDVVRLAKETKTQFVFLENVPAIRTRGLHTVVEEFSRIGYDSRWCCISAAEIGANHKRERWFLLACLTNGRPSLDDTKSGRVRNDGKNNGPTTKSVDALASASLLRRIKKEDKASWWAIEPRVGRMVNGLPLRVDRLRALGNAVVPEQAQFAFKKLVGLE